MGRPELTDELDAIERLVTHGSVVEAQKRLLTLLEHRISRRHLFRMANLLRRARLNERSVRLLHPVVRSERSAAAASDGERAEYAAALNAVGGSLEAERILSAIEPDRHPNALLFLAYARMWQWDWDAAIAPLERYVARRDVVPDMHYWGLQNLALALMHGPGALKAASDALDEVVDHTGADHFRMLHKTALVGLLQNAFLAHDWSRARALISRIETFRVGESDDVFDGVFELWKVLTALCSESPKSLSQSALRAIRARWSETGLWENMRGCDYYEASFTKDRRLLTQLYFGTPHAAFRSRVLGLLGGAEKLPASFEWGFFRPLPRGRRALDVTDGQFGTDGKLHLKEGQLCQRLLELLASDFYRPLQVAEIHERLYPGENFNPATSPTRVHQAVKRLRRWLTTQRLGFEIAEKHGRYRIAGNPCSTLLLKPPSRGGPRVPLRLRRQLETLRRGHGSAPLTAREAATTLKTSYRSAARLMKEAVGAGLATRVGSGPATAYRLSSAPGTRAA